MSRAKPKLEALSFDEWMRLADEAIKLNASLSIEDLPELRWADWYREGLSPGAGATLALEER
ncbi:MAG: hypothetical protein HY231_24040 [Acidobacteria bacterium]|nr:hypothetical protein [Acidobacteriota bacterium]